MAERGETLAYKDCIRCKKCDAIYNPSIVWAYGWRPKDDTSGIFHRSGTIPLGCCPVCRAPAEPT